MKSEYNRTKAGGLMTFNKKLFLFIRETLDRQELYLSFYDHHTQ